MKKILFFLPLLVLFSSCYKESNWIADNVDTEGYFYPLIQDVLAEPANGTDITEGSEVLISVYYWSRDDVASVELFETIDGNEKMIHSASAPTRFDAERSVDVLEYSYTVPAGTAGKDITIKAVVTTVNGLSREKATSFTVN